MRKLKLEELQRLDVTEYQRSDKHPVVLVLDNIRSKNNVGSLFRSADAFRIERIVLAGYTPAPPHRDIAKTALGAEMSVEWSAERDVEQAVRSLKDDGYRIACLEQTTESFPLNEFSRLSLEKYALVLGNEVEGVSEAVLEMADVALEIPQFGTKHSLNVAVAAGIALYAMVLNPISPST